MIAARQIAFGKAAGTKKPYDAEIEYLESTGTQWIDLTFGFDKTDEIYASFSIDTSEKIDKYIVAPKVWNNLRGNRFGMGVHTSDSERYTFAYGLHLTGISYLNPKTPNDGGVHHWSYANMIATISDLNLSRNVSDVEFNGETASLRLFYGYNAPTKGRVVSYKHIKNDIVVFDAIPVRVGDVGYMFDRVSGQLFGNAGTGAFVLGADIIDFTAKDYIQDGLVAMWDGIENAGWGKHDANATMWTDLVGEFDATPIDSPTFDENSSVLNGGYWEIPNTIIPIAESGNLTAEVVFKSNGYYYDNQGVIGIGQNRALWLFFGLPPTSPSGSTLNFQVRSSNSVRLWNTSNGAFGTNIHSASGVVENNLCSGYLDSIYLNGGISVGTSTSNKGCFLGFISGYSKFHGNIYSVRFYSRALTADEIAHNYSIDKARFGL